MLVRSLFQGYLRTEQSLSSAPWESLHSTGSPLPASFTTERPWCRATSPTEGNCATEILTIVDLNSPKNHPSYDATGAITPRQQREAIENLRRGK